MRSTLRRRDFCAGLGALYLMGASARLAIGAWVPRAPAWFSAWIPASFHVVLAAFVLALGGWHSARLARAGGAT